MQKKSIVLLLLILITNFTQTSNVSGTQNPAVLVTINYEQRENKIWVYGDILGENDILHDTTLYLILYHPNGNQMYYEEIQTIPIDSSNPEKHGYEYEVIDLTQNPVDGEWEVQAFFAGTEDWAPTSGYVTFEISDNQVQPPNNYTPSKKDTEFKALGSEAKEEFFIGDDAHLKIRLKDKETQSGISEVPVEILFKKPQGGIPSWSRTTTEIGDITIDYTFDEAGDWKITYNFHGDENYNPSTLTRTISVKSYFDVPSFPFVSMFLGISLIIYIQKQTRSLKPSNNP
jgi:hypothetical protein